MSKSVEQQINAIYNELFKKVFTNTTLAALSRGDKKPIKKQVLKMQSSKRFDDFAIKFSKILTRKGLYGTKGVWHKFYEAAKASDNISLRPTISYSEFEFSTMTFAIKQNFTMIKTIPSYFLDILNHTYVSTLIEQVAKGAIGRLSFRKQLEKHGHKNAKLIARTETAKLQTSILEARATQLGSVAYIWRASNDKRTRKSHKDMDGVIVFWKKPKPLLDGMVGHAGEFPNCRCSPQPIVDFDDLIMHTYKIYDYNKHKVVSILKKDLIESLNTGSL